jgi:pyridoxamine 5'-phosphate oxidase
VLDATDPHALFADWFAAAERAEPRVHDAVQIATVADGLPDVRTVLLKAAGPSGWWFYTNLGSAKARQLAEVPQVAALLHWKSLERQVRAWGPVELASDDNADAYFATRSRGSQLGAWASRQSDELPDRSTLDQRLAEVTARFEGQPVPRPPFWGGYRIDVQRFEFWQGRPDRLHDRLEFVRTDDGWGRRRLYP